jgi:hypothetical protein
MLETIPEEVPKAVIIDNGIIVTKVPKDILKLQVQVILIELELVKIFKNESIEFDCDIL